MSHFQLEGSHRAALTQEATPIDIAHTSMSMKVTLVLALGAELPSVKELCEEPPRQHLTHAQILERYGTPRRHLAVVERFADEHGLLIREVRPEHGLVTLAGTPKAMKSAFRVDLKQYARVEQKREHFYSHTRPIELPSELRHIVLGVFGLDTQPLDPHPLVHRCSVALPRPIESGAHEELLSYSAREVAQLYRYPPFQGAGQCLGLIELTGGYNPSDIETYFKRFGIDPNILVNVGPNKYGEDAFSDAEVTLDVEIAATVCPRSRIVVYNAGSSDYSLKDFLCIFSRAIGDQENQPSVLSTSWAFPEGPLIQQQEEQAFERLFSIAALMGITICGASGDMGSQVPIPFATPTQASTVPATYYPAASPLVLGCGGTTLIARDGLIQSERVWNRLHEELVMSFSDEEGAAPVAMAAGASGGGVSRKNDLPSYQRDMKVPETVTVSWTDGKFQVLKRQSGRGVPDVAANADLHTGYEVYFRGHWGVAAGTSAAAPMWAALVTRLNEGLGKRVGLLQPHLYQFVRGGAPVVRRITEGGNGAFFANPTSVWNPCTGLGSPDGEQLFLALEKALLEG
jgi:kumamolisin